MPAGFDKYQSKIPTLAAKITGIHHATADAIKANRLPEGEYYTLSLLSTNGNSATRIVVGRWLDQAGAMIGDYYVISPTVDESEDNGFPSPRLCHAAIWPADVFHSWFDPASLF